MQKILILAVGRLKEPYWQAAQQEFSLRSAPFAKLELVEVPAEPITGTVDAARSMKEEGTRLLARLKPDDAVIALDRLGRSLSSEKFAALIGELGEGGRRLVFVIGGAAGLAEPVLKRAERRVSFSEMTFTHEMARVLLLEQIYRAETILTGKKYHY